MPEELPPYGRTFPFQAHSATVLQGMAAAFPQSNVQTSAVGSPGPIRTDKWDEFFMSFGAQRRMKMGLGWKSCTHEVVTFNGAVSPQMSLALDAFRNNGLLPFSEEYARETLAIYASLRRTAWRRRWKNFTRRAVV